MADSHYKEYNIKKKSDVKTVVRKSFITRAQYEFQGEGATASGTLVLRNIMGQEDLFRKEGSPGTRVDNSLSARIIWTSGAIADSKVYYSAENESFNLESALLDDPASTNGVAYHEVFLYDLNIDTEYAFQVESYDAQGNTLRSDTYWFVTAGEIILDPSNLFAIPALLVDVISKSISILLTGLDSIPTAPAGNAEGIIALNLSMATPTTASHSQTITTDEDEFFTEIQTTVV